METNQHSVGLDGRTWKNICYAANRLARGDAVPGMSVEDYRQELALDLTRRSHRYDRTKASYPTFADRIIRHHAANLSAPSVRKREERRCLSLNAVVRDDDAGEHVELHELITDDMPPVDDRVAAHFDVSRFVSRLPDDHQQCCEILLHDSLAAGARTYGLPRATVYHRLAELRELAIAFGLGIYLDATSDSFATSPVCDQENVTAKQGGGEPRELPSMLIAPRPSLSITVAELSAWISSAAAGHRLEYFRGFLSLDRGPGSRLGKRDRDELDRVAATAMALADAGRVHLVQRRNGPCDYTYMVVAARGVSGHRSNRLAVEATAP